jgi:hypothetical protein
VDAIAITIDNEDKSFSMGGRCRENGKEKLLETE